MLIKLKEGNKYNRNNSNFNSNWSLETLSVSVISQRKIRPASSLRETRGRNFKEPYHITTVVIKIMGNNKLWPL